jgi:hypothetical protein
MSTVLSEPVQPDGGHEPSDLAGHADDIDRKQCNRYERPAMASSKSNSGPMAADREVAVEQVSASQKMLSATWGSLFTSLLGTF